MEKFSFIRHGHKTPSEEERPPLEESGLTPEQQEKWKQASEVVGEGVDPEITYDNVPLVEKMAEDIFGQLPDKALLLFASTDFPRTRMTNALLSMELSRLALEHPEKDITTGSIWDSPEIAEHEDSVSNLAGEAPEFGDMWREFKNSDEAKNDPSLADYFAQSGGGKTHPKELEIIYKLVEKDLASPNSVFRKRGEEMKKQIDAFKEKYKDIDVPTYFFGVGHITTLIALDTAVNGREKYGSVDEMPKPLTLWKAD
jgi:hypothetical protein